ncbi:hypothetical protein [Leucobacter insecticola]|uniref:hypothetical protein n=1 Tax=Leucobacter insecticola TaxID=2714934 RepID=UPI0031379270
MLQQSIRENVMESRETRGAYADPSVSAAQQRAPYAEALVHFAASSPMSLMVPGHGNDPAYGAQHLTELFGERVVELDAPLMLEGIDLGPDSPLVQAQQLAAEAWGPGAVGF